MIQFPGLPPRYFPKDFLQDRLTAPMDEPLHAGVHNGPLAIPEVVPEDFSAPTLPAASYVNPKARNLLFDFYNWHNQPHFIAVRDNEAFPRKEYRRIVNNHFQGIQRLNDGKHVVLSGGSKQSGCSNLFVTRIGSHIRKTGPIGTNLLRESIPSEKDVLESIILLDNNKYWHAGGISVCGDILVVPLEKDDTGSKVIFLNMKDPTKPIQYENEILRPHKKAGSASLIRLPNGYFLCAVWSDKDHYFDFYLSDEPKITSSFSRKELRIDYDRIRNKSKKNPRFQGITFVQQGDLIYIIGTGNTQKMAPVIRGKNQAHLFEIRLRDATTKSTNPELKVMDVLQVGQRDFGAGKTFYDMGAAGAAFVSKDGRVSMYSGHHWRRKRMLRFAEFDPPLMATDPELLRSEKAIIELYEHRDFKGRCLKLFGTKPTHSYIQDYQKIFVQKMNFEKKISSIRAYLPVGLRYVLYEKTFYQGASLEIIGNGFLQEFPDLGSYNDRICSSKYLTV